MDINVVDRLTSGELAFNNVMLDSHSLGDFDDEGWKNWTVSNYDFSQGFTVSGDMVVQGWTGSETNKLQLVVGCVTPPPSVTPVSEDPLVCDEGTVNIVIDDVENLYGYEFEVTYDHTLVDATGSLSMIGSWMLLLVCRFLGGRETVA